MKRVLFFAQDVGSAKALIPIILNFSEMMNAQVIVVAKKPAFQTFSQNGIASINAENQCISDYFEPKPDLIFTGASMRSSVEKKAIAFAQKMAVRSVTLLDSHLFLWWRFTLDGMQDSEALPDYILAPDAVCREQMIKEGFPEGRVLVTGNPHFDTLIRPGADHGHPVKRAVLVVTQPRYLDGLYQSDPQWLETVLITCRQLDPDLHLTIRPHSKENCTVRHTMPFSSCHIDGESELADLIDSHPVIIGKNSSALLEALLMGKKVITFSGQESELLTIQVCKDLGLNRAMDQTILKKTLTDCLHDSAPCPEKRIIPYYTDGKNGERVLQFLRKILAE